jgi:hypothetical protein
VCWAQSTEQHTLSLSSQTSGRRDRQYVHQHKLMPGSESVPGKLYNWQRDGGVPLKRSCQSGLCEDMTTEQLSADIKDKQGCGHGVCVCVCVVCVCVCVCVCVSQLTPVLGRTKLLISRWL